MHTVQALNYFAASTRNVLILMHFKQHVTRAEGSKECPLQIGLLRVCLIILFKSLYLPR